MSDNPVDDRIELKLKNFDTIRDEILNAVLISISAVSLLPLFASLLRIKEIGWKFAMYFQILSFLVIVITTIFHKKIPYKHKALVLVSIAFMIGCTTTASIGLIGSGILFMVFSIILATMFFGTRYGIILVLIGMFYLSAITFGIWQSWISYSFNIENAGSLFSSWFSKICVFFLFSTILIFSLGRLINYLVYSSKTLQQSSFELKSINSRLRQEISEKKYIQEGLKESEAKYRRIFENSVIGIVQATIEGQFMTVNQAVANMLKYDSPEDLLSSINDLSTQVYVNESDRKKYLEIIQKYGKTDGFEFKARCKDGSEIWVSNSGRVCFNDDGKISHLESVISDITNRVESEKLIKSMEKQLIQSQKMEAIGTLAGGIAHDFNNILAAVIGYTELLQMNLSINSPESDYAHQIYKASNRAKDLVRQILAFSRQAEKEPKLIQISSIVKEVAKLLRSSLPSTIEIKPNIQNHLHVMADPTEIHQILMNLCTNAGHSMHEKGGILTLDLKLLELNENMLKAGSKLTPGIYVQLNVSDTGHGIPAEIIDRVFDPFFTTKKRNEGTGMGLSVVHGIVKSYQGEISVHSEVGQGTTITVLLPAVKNISTQETCKTEDIPRGKEHILFIDDEPVLVEMGVSQLKSLGYKVSSRSSSVEALALFQNLPLSFDLVITDMTMPTMTGDELSKEIKRIRPEIPVILCSGFSSKITSENAHNFDIDAYIMKPIILRDMANIIRRVLD